MGHLFPASEELFLNIRGTLSQHLKPPETAHMRVFSTSEAPYFQHPRPHLHQVDTRTGELVVSDTRNHRVQRFAAVRTRLNHKSIQNRGIVVTEAGSYSRLIDSCITQLKAQAPPRTCNQSKGEKEGFCPSPVHASLLEGVQGHFVRKKPPPSRTLL